VAEMEVELPAGVSDVVRSLFEAYDNTMTIPDELEDAETLQVYERIANGCCMTCGGELGHNTMVTVCQVGIVLVYCGGACYTDMQVMHWLSEMYDDMVSKIKFRGGPDAN
jgi:hypothetical protein